jgi:hypothetical protein
MEDLSQGVAMTANNPPDEPLTDEDAEILARLQAVSAERDSLLAAGLGRPVARPEKFADPIGLDDDGNPFPVHADTDGDGDGG